VRRRCAEAGVYKDVGIFERDLNFVYKIGSTLVVNGRIRKIFDFCSRDPISALKSDFVFWRCFLDEVRTFFEQNPH